MNIYLIEDEGGEFAWVAAKTPEEAADFFNDHSEENESKYVNEISPATWDTQYVRSDDGSATKTFSDIMAEPRTNDEPFVIAESV